MVGGSRWPTFVAALKKLAAREKKMQTNKFDGFVYEVARNARRAWLRFDRNRRTSINLRQEVVNRCAQLRRLSPKDKREVAKGATELVQRITSSLEYRDWDGTHHLEPTWPVTTATAAPGTAPIVWLSLFRRRRKLGPFSIDEAIVKCKQMRQRGQAVAVEVDARCYYIGNGPPIAK